MKTVAAQLQKYSAVTITQGTCFRGLSNYIHKHAHYVICFFKLCVFKFDESLLQ